MVLVVDKQKHYTALHLSCGVGAVEIVGALLAHPGVSINAQDEVQDSIFVHLNVL